MLLYQLRSLLLGREADSEWYAGKCGGKESAVDFQVLSPEALQD